MVHSGSTGILADPCLPSIRARYKGIRLDSPSFRFHSIRMICPIIMEINRII